MPNFHVRCFRRDELSALLELYRYLHQDDPVVDMAYFEAVWDAILADPLRCYLAGDLDGAVVSTCNLTIIPNLTRGARPYGLIENVVTLPDHRKKGYASAVLRYALQVAWDHGCYKVMLLTGSKKEETLRFYENAGFKRGVKTGFIAYPETGG